MNGSQCPAGHSGILLELLHCLWSSLLVSPVIIPILLKCFISLYFSAFKQIIFIHKTRQWDVKGSPFLAFPTHLSIWPPSTQAQRRPLPTPAHFHQHSAPKPLGPCYSYNLPLQCLPSLCNIIKASPILTKWAFNSVFSDRFPSYLSG